MRVVDGMLHLIKAYPSLCDPAEGMTAREMERRPRGRSLMCLACGSRATVSLVATTKDGPRWVDVCMDDYAALRTPEEGQRWTP